MTQWIVVKTKGSRERYAAENVARQDHEFYLPLQLSYRGRGKLRHAIPEPVFPSYLFVLINQEWRFLLGTFGVSSIILNGQKPAVMPLAAIIALKKREESGFFVPTPMKIGSQIKIKEGSFADHFGIYQGQSPRDRAKVLMDILGGKRTIEMDNDALELVA